MIKKTNNRGFTIVELLIVTTILSVVLLGASFMLIQMGRLYYKGLAASRTQDTARNLVDSIARPLQLGGGSFVPFNAGTFCIGSNQFNINSADSAGNPHPAGLKKITRQQITGPCGSAAGTGPEEALLGENMWLVGNADSLVQFNNPAYTINVHIMYGDRDLMEPDAPGIAITGCKGSEAGSQWCASATYKTQVVPRM